MVVAVVALDDDMATVPIRVETFTVALPLGSVCIVVLNDGIVRAPAQMATLWSSDLERSQEWAWRRS